MEYRKSSWIPLNVLYVDPFHSWSTLGKVPIKFHKTTNTEKILLSILDIITTSSNSRRVYEKILSYVGIIFFMRNEVFYTNLKR